jgi:hypothetical protein
MMTKLPRRQVLHLAAGAVVFPATSPIARAQTDMTRPNSEKPVRPLAERLAGYADGLRYDDLDAETIERVKSHVIDTLGCGIAAFDERPVRICRDLVLAAATGASTVIGTSQRTTPDLAAFAQWRRVPVLRSERRLCRPFLRPSQRQYRGMPGGCRVRTRERQGADHRDRSRLRGQLPADRCLRYHHSRLGPAGIQPAGRSACRREADEASGREAHAGGQSGHQRPHPHGADPVTDPVRLEGACRRRGRPQCGVRRDAGAGRTNAG